MRHSEIIQKMTLAEKCALLSGKDVWHTREIERLGIPSITLSDGPSGLRKQAGAGDHLGLNESTKATCMPSAATVANSWNTNAAEAAGRVIGAEAAGQDVQVLLGPGLNIKRSPLCGRNFEYYSEDPYLSGKMAAGFIRGIQENGVSACPKHFAVNNQEAHRMASDSVLDERTLREIYLTGFEIAIKEGKPKAVMSSYNMVNGTYANENTHLVKEILRGEWGFDGAVVTDWGGGNDFVEGVRTGCSLEMPGCGDDSACQLLHAVKDKKIEEETVNQRVDELLELILSTTNAKNADKVATKEAEKEEMQRDHHKTAAWIAEESIVLLKNEKDILPLDTGSRVAFIGDFVEHPRYQGAGSSMVNAAEEENTRIFMKKYFPNYIGYAAGFRRKDEPDAELLSEAVELAERADQVVLYLGLTEGYETEGLDRSHMRIPENQVQLLKAIRQVTPYIIVVLSAGSPVEMPWIDLCVGVLYAGLSGEAGAGAVLRALSGKLNPSGHLAETFPIEYEKTPVSRYYPGRERTSEYREGIYVGYRYYETADAPVRFPFGHGLSYTSFRYENLQVTQKEVCFELTNIGGRAGAEVPQLYVHLPNASVFRAELELKGFAKIYLKPGEKKRVTITIDKQAFRYYNVKTGSFETESGTYQLMIGSSVRDIRLQGTIQIAGSNAPNPYEHKNLDGYVMCRLQEIPDAQFAALLGRAIPEQKWDISSELGRNDAVLQMYYAKNPLAKMVWRILNKQIEKNIRDGKPDLNLLFIYNIPFRGIAKMMNGMVSMEMADAMLLIVNGHRFRGVGKLIRGFFHRPDLKKEVSK